jgi:hypothetical protein
MTRRSEPNIRSDAPQLAFRAPALDPSGSPDTDAVEFYNEVGRRFWLGTSSPDALLWHHRGPCHTDGFTEKDLFKTGTALNKNEVEGNSWPNYYVGLSRG